MSRYLHVSFCYLNVFVSIDSNTNADITDVNDVDVKMTNGESNEPTNEEAMEQEGEFDCPKFAI